MKAIPQNIKDEVIKSYTTSLISQEELSQKLGIGVSTIQKILRTHRYSQQSPRNTIIQPQQPQQQGGAISLNLDIDKHLRLIENTNREIEEYREADRLKSERFSEFFSKNFS